MSSTASAVAVGSLPAATPPPGVVSNLTDPHSNGFVLITVGSLLVAIMLLLLSTRLYVKFAVLRETSPDDWTCIIGTIGAVLYFIVCVFAVTTGKMGTHLWDLTAADLGNNFLVPVYFANWVSTAVWPFIKITFFLLYIQLFRPLRWLKWSSYIGIVVTAVFYAALLIAQLVLVTPAPGESWEASIQEPRYLKSLLLAVPVASVGLVLDIYILVLPIAGVSTLQLSNRRKFGVVLVFMTGLMACIASSLGVYYKNALKRDSSDTTWKLLPVILTSLVEMCVGVSVSCVPALSHLLRQRSKESSALRYDDHSLKNLRPRRRSGSMNRQHSSYTNIKAECASSDNTRELDPIKSHCRSREQEW